MNVWPSFDAWCYANGVDQDHESRLLLRSAWLEASKQGEQSRSQEIAYLETTVAGCDELIAISRVERDKLRSALNLMLTQFGMDEDEWTAPVFKKAREALMDGP